MKIKIRSGIKVLCITSLFYSLGIFAAVGFLNFSPESWRKAIFGWFSGLPF